MGMGTGKTKKEKEEEMTITNNQYLPDVLYDVLAKDFYNYIPADDTFSVTELLNPSKITLLRRRHREEIVQDVTDLFYRTWGNLMHMWLENFSEGECLKEERLRAKLGRYYLTGKPDLYYDKTIWDYKLTSVWTFIYKSRQEDWEKQLNMYNYLFFQAVGLPVKTLKVLAMFRDWSKTRNQNESEYPNQVEVINVPMWNGDKIEDYIQQRFNALGLCDGISDDAIIPCSQKDVWQDDDKYAVMKKGRKSAVKLFDNEDDALTMAQDKGKDHSVVKREGKPKRCIDYCDVNNWCSFYQQYLINGGKDGKGE